MKNNELFLQFKWLTICICACGLLGAFFAGLQVTLFEQTESGRYAVHNECVEWNEDCVYGCQQAQYDNPENPPSCNECCVRYKDVAEPLGKRIAEVAKLYSVLGGSLGIVIGLTIADEKRKKLIS